MNMGVECTFVETVLILLRLLATASQAVELVHETAARRRLVRRLLLCGLALLVVAGSEVLYEIHDVDEC